MEKKELSDLIDQYLLGSIHPQDEARLEYLRKTDPLIDHEIKSGKEVLNVLRYLRYKELKEKLHKIDNADSKQVKHRVTHRWIFCSLILLISFSGIGLWTWYHFTPASIALNHFHQLTDTYTSIADLKDVEADNWKEAVKAMSNNQFPEAIILFQPFVENHLSEISCTAEWNILLARFALNGYDESWKYDLIQFRSQAAEPYRREAGKLLRTIDSPFYTFFVLRMPSQISSFKPRLM